MPDRLVTEAVQSLLLPIDPDMESEAVAAVREQLSGAGLSAAEHAAVLRLEALRWKEGNAPSQLLKDVVRAALTAASGSMGPSMATQYFQKHEALRNSLLLTFEGASGLLSSQLLALDLVDAQHMSCAQVARILSSQRGATEYTWQQVKELCKGLVPLPDLDEAKVAALTDADRVVEVERFADATAEDVFAILSTEASELGFPGDLGALLEQLVTPEPNGAYLIILHFEAAVAAFYDHPLSAAYELEPRGSVASYLQELHPSYTAAENAFLNNAKGTSRFDDAWVWGRKKALRQRAKALVRILEGLDSMSFVARRELAAWLRQWAIRVERLHSEQPSTLALFSSTDVVRTFYEGVASAPTQSCGVLEQRVVDALSTAVRKSEPGWSSRGIGDSVFASNLRRRKTGDCEFERPDQRQIHAYEAHGGQLAPVYVELHKRTLGAVLALRRPDLEATAPATDWEVKITFVAHDLGGLTAHQQVIEGFTVEFGFITYDELLAEAEALWSGSEDEWVDLANGLVIERLNAGSTPNRFRERAASLSGLGLTAP